MGYNATLDNTQADRQREQLRDRFGSESGLGVSNTIRTNALFPGSPIIPENRVSGDNDRGGLFDEVGNDKSLERAFMKVVDPSDNKINGMGFYGTDEADLNYSESPGIVRNSYNAELITTDNDGNTTWAFHPDLQTRDMNDPGAADTDTSNDTGISVLRTNNFGTDTTQGRAGYSEDFGNGSDNFSNGDAETIGQYFRNSRNGN